MQEILRDLWHLILAGVDWALRVVALIWLWSVDQISQLPWDNLGDLPLWKLLLLFAAAGIILALIVWIALALVRIGARLMAAIVTVFAVALRTVPAIAVAGLIAAGAAYIINHFPAGEQDSPLAKDLEALQEDVAKANAEAERRVNPDAQTPSSATDQP